MSRRFRRSSSRFLHRPSQFVEGFVPARSAPTTATMEDIIGAQLLRQAIFINHHSKIFARRSDPELIMNVNLITPASPSARARR